MEVDIDNTEDVNELEERLYAQVHHDTVDDNEAPPPDYEPNTNRTVTNSSIINEPKDKRPKCRYYIKEQYDGRSRRHINPFAAFPNALKTMKECSEDVALKGNVFTPFRPYTPYLHNEGVIPEASGDDPNPKGSSLIPRDQSKSKQNLNNIKKIRKQTSGMDPNILKLGKIIKYRMNKVKARENRTKALAVATETIVLESSDDECDVEEVPLPEPPILTIDSSDESGTDANCDMNDFTKPNAVDELNNKSKPSTSRCISPSSVMSDDFIGLADRSRLLKEENKTVDEGISLQESDEKYIGQVKENKTSFQPQGTSKNCTPLSKERTNNYQVTQSAFKAVDVYESESSDMPDSVYIKGMSKVQEKISSHSEVEEIGVPQKAKKLRKRIRSGSNKSAETNGDSTDSEDAGTAKTCVPYISRGEAVERFKNKSKRVVQQSSDGNSDNEFVTILRAISKGDSEMVTHQDSDASMHSDEEITARAIAEKVLQKKSDQESNDGILDISVETSEAIPFNSTLELEKVLDSIDSIKSADLEENKSENEYEEINEESLAITALMEKSNKRKPVTDDDIMHTVISNSTPIGWNEEMIRFYTMSWGGESFSVRKVKSTLDASSKWNIKPEDRLGFSRKRNIKCLHCSEYGHIRSKCPRRKQLVVCHMCGEIGHKDFHCPNAVCLRCGNKTKIFTRNCKFCSGQDRMICPICKIPGHSVELCPDKWRRYHSTTTPNEYPKKEIYNKMKFCCICADFGHYPETCRGSLKFQEYPITLSVIKSHTKSYDDILLKGSLAPNTIGYHLFFNPDEKISFTFTSQITLKQCYGRFLEAVGLSLVSLRKRKLNHDDDKKEHKKKRNYVINPFNKSVSKDDIVLNISDNLKVNENEIFKTPEITKVHNKSRNSQNSEEKKCVKKILSVDQKEGSEEMEDLLKELDFIPLEQTSEEYEDKTEFKDFKLKREHDNVNPDSEIPGEASIYITDFHYKYLCCEEGNEFVKDACAKYNVKASIQKRSVGNVLVIEGLVADQNNFHADLIQTFRDLSEKKNRIQLERSQRIPRKRSTLLRFLKEHLLQLKDNLGNVIQLNKKLESCKKLQTKSSWTIAEKTKKKLNIILLAQTGLKDGHKHLNALIEHYKELRKNIYIDLLPDKLRDKIENHWKYLFTSHTQDDYEKLIGMYLEMKRKGILPKIEIDEIFDKYIPETSTTEESTNNDIESEPENLRFQDLKTSTPIQNDMKSWTVKRENFKIKRENFYGRSPVSHYGRNHSRFRSSTSNTIREMKQYWGNRWKNLLEGIEKPKF